MFVIHAGLHKTGSTAIQSYFGHNRVDGVHYLDWRDPNHSDLSVLLFDDAPEKYWIYAREGRTPQEMLDWREEVTANLQRDLAANAAKTHVFSAEGLAIATPAAIERMYTLFSPYADPFKVIIYVRPAEGYMTSMAQQYIRTGTADIRLIWPDYRKAVEKLDDVFGRQAVDVRLYNPPGQADWDAVTDFCDTAGIQPPENRPPRENVGMGARHLALLLDRRAEIGHGPRNPEEAHADHEFLMTLLQEPSPPFALDPDLLRAEIAKHSDDLAWIEARLGGVSMATMSPIKPDTIVFGSTEDALTYAQTCKAAQNQKPAFWTRARRIAGRIKRRILRG